MPTFIDRHLLAAVPRAIRQQIHLEAMLGIVDPHGVLSLAHWVEDAYIYCVLQAPKAQAICLHHAARGLACDELHPITGFQGGRPLTSEEERGRAHEDRSSVACSGRGTEQPEQPSSATQP